MKIPVTVFKKQLITKWSNTIAPFFMSENLKVSIEIFIAEL